MSSKASTDAMASLHNEVAKQLLERVKSGAASAADISNAIKFLKDNGIEADAVPGSPTESLARQFPSFNDDQDGDHAVN